jgi:hypothetical protein
MFMSSWTMLSRKENSHVLGIQHGTEQGNGSRKLFYKSSVRVFINLIYNQRQLCRGERYFASVILHCCL